MSAVERVTTSTSRGYGNRCCDDEKDKGTTGDETTDEGEMTNAVDDDGRDVTTRK